MKIYCVFCGQKMTTSTLPDHIWEYHPEEIEGNALLKDWFKKREQIKEKKATT